MKSDEAIAVADYRRRIHELYATARAGSDAAAMWHRWRQERDLLFRTHPASAIEASVRARFTGLRYFDYDPAYRFVARVKAIEAPSTRMSHSGQGTTTFMPIGTISMAGIGINETLVVYWLDAYGGGLFLPFRDATAGGSTYGGGRYLLDTVKGADLGGVDGRIVIDLNYAYHPSCVYSPRWSCPLAPRENWLRAAIPAGERLPEG
jgi:uncharacterized protein (DUF1684 family)